MKIIKDPVHGYVEVEEGILPILDSPPVQRLRYIRQLGFSHLVYPGANHTRFEHALGTMYLAGMLSRQLGLAPDETAIVTTAALLHDIGHGPYSHATEPLMRTYTGRDHTDIRGLLTAGDLAGRLEERGIDPAEIAALVDGTHRLAGIIHGELDVDRMDYLLRDAHYTGVPYGTVDAQRLIHSIKLAEPGIVLDESGIHAAESLLIARTLMRPAVYFHHVGRIAESMILHAATEHLRATGIGGAPALLAQDDTAFTHALLASPSDDARAMVDRILHRRLYKRALWAGHDAVNAQVLSVQTGLAGERTIADAIAEAAGVAPGDVLVDIPPIPPHMSVEVQVTNRHDLVDLEQISPLVGTLNRTRREQWRMGVYAAPDRREQVEAAAIEVLHVRKPTRQDKLGV
ncbi:MAG: HD domain-containing protein [Methanomicrobiales archaeon]|nr:HD domain-containing protein [Methanomicrobiales archaeon]